MSNVLKLAYGVKQLRPKLTAELEKQLNQHVRTSVNDFLSRRPRTTLNDASYQNIVKPIVTANELLVTSEHQEVSSHSHQNPRSIFSSYGSQLFKKSSLISADIKVLNPYLCVRTFSSSKDDKDDDTDENALSIFQRFKRAYKKHGKVLVGVHLATSTVWFGSFYAAAAYGFDIIPFLENLGASETLLKPFRSSGVGDLALAYLMYKVATPARYAVTLGGTNLAIRYLKKKGQIAVPEDDKLKNLYQDSKEIVKEKLEKKNLPFYNERINQNLKASREKRTKIKNKP